MTIPTGSEIPHDLNDIQLNLPPMNENQEAVNLAAAQGITTKMLREHLEWQPNIGAPLSSHSFQTLDTQFLATKHLEIPLERGSITFGIFSIDTPSFSSPTRSPASSTSSSSAPSPSISPKSSHKATEQLENSTEMSTLLLKEKLRAISKLSPDDQIDAFHQEGYFVPDKHHLNANLEFSIWKSASTPGSYGVWIRGDERSLYLIDPKKQNLALSIAAALK